MEISKSTDAERTQEFLEVEFIENSIDPLFFAANDHMDLVQYVLPEQDNAYHDYQQIITFYSQWKN